MYFPSFEADEDGVTNLVRGRPGVLRECSLLALGVDSDCAPCLELGLVRAFLGRSTRTRIAVDDPASIASNGKGIFLDKQLSLGTFRGSLETKALGLAFSVFELLALGVATVFDEGAVLDLSCTACSLELTLEVFSVPPRG